MAGRLAFEARKEKKRRKATARPSRSRTSLLLLLADKACKREEALKEAEYCFRHAGVIVLGQEELAYLESQGKRRATG